jgi:PAS domain S-box-containing protein
MGSNPRPGDFTPPRLSSPWFEDDAAPIATTEGPTHRIHDVNPAFCRLTGNTREDLLGKPFCELLPQGQEYRAQLDTVYRTGKPALPDEQDGSAMAFCSFAMWPVVADERTIGVVIQVTDNAQLQERTLAMNEALLLGSLRQHELAAAANETNIRLQAEIVQRIQSESDALMLTKEISHRIKNNLQVVIAMMAREI